MGKKKYIVEKRENEKAKRWKFDGQTNWKVEQTKKKKPKTYDCVTICSSFKVLSCSFFYLFSSYLKFKLKKAKIFFKKQVFEIICS